MENQNDPKEESRRRPYQKPTLTKLTPEEAKLKLIDHARLGDQGATDMLKMMFSEEAKKQIKAKKGPA